MAGAATEGRPAAADGGAARRPLAIVAGGGRLPSEVAEAARRAGREVIVFRIAEKADAPRDGLEAHTLHFGQLGRLFDMLAARDCHDLAFVGSIRRRPDYRAIAGDLATLKRLPKIMRALVGGDDTVIRKVLKLFEAEGFRVLPIAEIAPDLLAGEGSLGRCRVAAGEDADIRRGLDLLAATSAFDIGQAAVVVANRVVAVEAAEGTDAMLARVATLRQEGRVRGPKRRGVLVKTAKRGQDLRTDLPVIGAETARLAAAADLAGIAVEAGRTLIAERAATIAAADRSGLFLAGVTAP